MTTTRTWFWLACVALTAACTGPSEGIFHFGIATPSCGIADGPVVSIQLTPAAGPEPIVPPFIEVRVAETRETLAPGRWSIITGSIEHAPSTANAAYCSAPGHCIQATSGSLKLSRVSIPDLLTGDVSLDFPQLGRLRGSFEVNWVQRGVICG